MDDNPFEAPRADGDALDPGAGSFRVEGELLVMSSEGPALPDRCVKCNAPATQRFAKTLQWIPKWVPFTILLCWPIYFAAFFMMRKTGKVNVGLCDEHHSRHKMFQTVGGGMLIGGLVLMFGGIFAEMLGVMGLGFILLFGGIFAMLPGRVVWPSYMDDEEGHYKGASPEFLNSL